MLCPYPLGSVQGTVWLPDWGPVLQSSLSITRSVCPTLAVRGQPTSCCGDVFVRALKEGAQTCVAWGKGKKKLLEAASDSILPATPSAEETRKLASVSRLLWDLK